VLLAGKGHETYQEFADLTLPFDDAAIAAGAMADRREAFPERFPRGGDHYPSDGRGINR